MSVRVLIIDDDQDFGFLLTNILEKNGYQVKFHHETKNIIENITNFNPDIILLDVVMPDRSGIEVLTEIKNSHPHKPILMISHRDDVKLVVAAMKAGASDYIPKTIDNDELISKIRNIHEIELIKETEDKLRKLSEIIGESPHTKNLIKIISIMARSDAPVFLKGESGTGKSLVAEAIHKCSKRKDAPFVTISCPAIPSTLLESEFFGHEKGAFTGAIRTKEGKFEIANGGTVFLDEIGDLSIDLQVKILRVIQNREFERVGGLKTIKVDARIIAATNQNVEQAIKEGKFREDLYYRLNVLPIYITPLRERKDDIPILAEHFLKLSSKKENKKFNSFSNEVVNLLMSYEWPGNIRELENVIERAVILGKEPELKVKDFSFTATLEDEVIISNDKPTLASLKDMEYTNLVNALKKSSGNISQAAKLLNISRDTLYRRMKKYGIGLKH